MKNFILTTSVFVVVSLLVGTDLCPCITHAATLLNHDEATALLNIDGEKFELSRQKRQPPFNSNTGYVAARTSRISPVPSAPFTADYLEKSRVIFHAHQILYGPLLDLHGLLNNNIRDDTLDLSKVLNYFKYQRNFNVNRLPQNLKTNFPKFNDFQQMYLMRNEVSHQSYSVSCFNSDRAVLIAVAKYIDGVNSGTSGGTGVILGWQGNTAVSSTNIRNRQTLELAITVALGNRGSSSRSSNNNNQLCSPSTAVTFG